MEVIFGGGISRVIGKATNQSQKIDGEAQKAIQHFWEINTESKQEKPEALEG